MNDAERMLKILGALPDHLRPWSLPQIFPGSLRLSREDYLTPDAAFKAFREFAGPGWLQDARVPKVLLFDDGICPQLDAAWPEHGERVSDDKNSSVQLRRVATGWRLTTLTRLSGNEARVLMQERRLRNDLSSHVVYEVAWEPVSIGAAPFAHDELRPVASRFLGFAPR